MGEDPKPNIYELQGGFEKMLESFNAMKEMVEGMNDSAMAAQLHEDRMDKAIAAYKHRGNMEKFVDTFRDLDDDAKASFLDDAFIRAKGAPPKINPFRERG